jgi:hypothetical protein
MTQKFLRGRMMFLAFILIMSMYEDSFRFQIGGQIFEAKQLLRRTRFGDIATLVIPILG